MDSKKIPLTVCLLIDMQSGKVDGVRCISTNEGLMYMGKTVMVPYITSEAEDWPAWHAEKERLFNMDPMLRMNRQWIQRGPGGTWA